MTLASPIFPSSRTQQHREMAEAAVRGTERVAASAATVLAVVAASAAAQRWLAPLAFVVGIIMYLPTSDPRQRKYITKEFFNYRSLTQTSLWNDYSAYEHWAKIEVPKDKDELAELHSRLRKRFPVDAYNKARMELDPNKVLSSAKLEKLFPVMGTVQHAK